MHNTHESICLEPTWFWIYQPNQTKTNYLTHRNFLFKKTAKSGNDKLWFFQIHSNYSLIPMMTLEKHHHYSFNAQIKLKIEGYKDYLECSWLCTLPMHFVDYGKIKRKYHHFHLTDLFLCAVPLTIFVWQSTIP